MGDQGVTSKGPEKSKVRKTIKQGWVSHYVYVLRTCKKLFIYMASIPVPHMIYHADLLFDIFAFTYSEAQHPVQPTMEECSS